VHLEDALIDDVLLAEHLDGQPLNPDHGAPLRLVSPSQSTKHLCAIEIHTCEPRENFGAASTLARVGFSLPIFRRHPRARVWREERHPYLAPGLLRSIYRLLIGPIKRLSAHRESDRD
jgi:DMSO/TMAO reductase YedYZ molybdopterin-dependent catalytic subunit